MKLSEIAKLVSGKLWQKDIYTRIYYNPRKDMSVWIDIENYMEDNGGDFIYQGSSLHYKFTTQNVHPNWVKSQWQQRQDVWLLVHDTFIAYAKGYENVSKRLQKIEGAQLSGEFYEIAEGTYEFCEMMNNVGRLSKEEAEAKLLGVLDLILEEEEEPEEVDIDEALLV
jgi:hypothetical protein